MRERITTLFSSPPLLSGKGSVEEEVSTPYVGEDKEIYTYVQRTHATNSIDVKEVGWKHMRIHDVGQAISGGAARHTEVSLWPRAAKLSGKLGDACHGARGVLCEKLCLLRHVGQRRKLARCTTRSNARSNG